MLFHLHLHFNLVFFFFSFSVLEKYVKPAEFLYGRLIRVWVLIFPFFAVIHPEDLQTVLSSRKHTEKIFFYKLLHNFLGNGLITSSGNSMHFLFQTLEILFPSINGLQLNSQLQKNNSRLFEMFLNKISMKIESGLLVEGKKCGQNSLKRLNSVNMFSMKSQLLTGSGYTFILHFVHFALVLLALISSSTRSFFSQFQLKYGVYIGD